MCGIAGYAGDGDRALLERMTRALSHRGPDDEGFFFAPGVGFGHRRLSIIDLGGGHQPMSSADSTLVTTFNGEIYNFKELREVLIRAGHVFRTASDTEVLLAGYREWGTDVFARLNGMWAAGIWDERHRALILSRDRFGKKPLFWMRLGHTLYFASELKALLLHPALRRELDPASVDTYLAFEYVPTPRTIIRGVHKLEPGTWVSFDSATGNSTARVYWDAGFDRVRGVASEEEWLARFDRELAAATRRRLLAADVPVGIFLSGGIDSSTVAYYARRAATGKVTTFTVRFDEASFDEAAYARRVATHLGTEHLEGRVTARDALELVPRLPELMDEPLADASIIPTFLLSRFAREQVKVVLGGDGGDELLLGYPHFPAQRFARIWQRLPAVIRTRLLAPFLHHIPASARYMSAGFKIERFLAGADEPDPFFRDLLWRGSFGPLERRSLLSPAFAAELGQDAARTEINRRRAAIASEPFWNQLVYQYLKGYLLDDVLAKVDRASMATSLEVRAPFLDVEVADLLNAMPATLKLRGWTGKYILKRLMRGKLPDEIVDRPKKGFAVPIADWLRGPLRPLLEDALSERRLAAGGVLDPRAVRSLVAEHLSGRRDHRKQLWTLLVFQWWCDRFVRAV